MGAGSDDLTIASEYSLRRPAGRVAHGPASALLLSGIIAAGVMSGCGGTHRSLAELRLEREDLIIVSRALKQVEGPVAVEVAATKRAWPLIVDGLPAGAQALASARAPVTTAAVSAARIKTPPLLAEALAASLTGPASPLAALFRTYTGLATRGWTLIRAAIDQIEHGSPASARFARENVALYIESVYDGHFDLAQIDKKLRAGYRTLGGQPQFGSALTQSEVNALADTYSEATDRLHPHVGVRLGS
jgi:hypothetical protein